MGDSCLFGQGQSPSPFHRFSRHRPLLLRLLFIASTSSRSLDTASQLVCSSSVFRLLRLNRLSCARTVPFCTRGRLVFPRATRTRPALCTRRACSRFPRSDLHPLSPPHACLLGELVDAAKHVRRPWFSLFSSASTCLSRLSPLHKCIKRVPCRQVTSLRLRLVSSQILLRALLSSPASRSFA